MNGIVETVYSITSASSSDVKIDILVKMNKSDLTDYATIASDFDKYKVHEDNDHFFVKMQVTGYKPVNGPIGVNHSIGFNLSGWEHSSDGTSYLNIEHCASAPL
jgi:hypothetical protein